MPTLRIRTDDTANLTGSEIVETLLVESGAAEDFPTDEHRLLGFLGLRQLSFDFMRELDFIESDDHPAKELRAALSLKDRIVAVQSDLSKKRCKFSILHEIGHFILPEHRDKLFLDSDETLSWWTQVRLEREANEVAAELLFQGDRFTNEAIDYPLSWQSVLRLAPRYGASYEATARRYVEKHVLPCALIVYDKITKTNEVDFAEEVYRLQYTITSEPFRKQFFRGFTSADTFKSTDLYKTKHWGEITEDELTVGRENSPQWHFDTQVFSNGYKIFQLIKRAKEST